MTIFNLGSINIDHVYAVPHLPQPGETLATTRLVTGLGGKGANQSVAAARAGARVVHVGAVGPDGDWAVERLAGFGVDTRHIGRAAVPTGHANVCVDPAGENLIVIFPGANAVQDEARIAAALAEAGPGDFLLLQNETNLAATAARLARQRGMRVVYSAAPFDAMAVREVLPEVDILALNAVEARQLALALGTSDLPARAVLTTMGAEGAMWQQGQDRVRTVGHKVTAVDTTGAGDTYLGYFVAGMDSGLPVEEAMALAGGAAALKVTRAGTAAAIPSLAEVTAFLNRQGARKGG